MARKNKIIIDYSRIEQAAWQLAESAIVECGAELIDVEYVKEAGSWFLRYYIDREEPPVDHNLCEQVSNRLSVILDANDPIPESYFLEISSPGLERPLKREKDFVRFAGQEVAVLLYAPEDGKKNYQGILVGLEDEALVLLIDDQRREFAIDKVAKTHLVAQL